MILTMLAFVAMLVIGIPVSFCLGASTFLFLIQKGIPIELVSQRMFTGLDSFPFMAIPFFVLAGELMNRTGVTKRLVKMADVFVGRMRGGLGQVNVVTSMFFAGLSGSAVADTASEGPIIIPAMVEEGYDPDYAAAITCASSVIGPIIPPSIPLVVYALITSTSVAALFFAGIFTGVLLGISQMVVNWIVATRRNYPRRARWPTVKEMAVAVLEGILPLMLVVIILGGIRLGVFTATEASAIAVAYALFLGVIVYRKLGWKELRSAVIGTARTTGVVFLLIACSNVFNWALVVEQVPQKAALWVAEVFTNKYLLLLGINILLLIVGCFMEGTAAMIILVPILVQITKPFGVDPVHLGIIVVLNLMIGLITPPVGLCLFIACNIAKRPIEKVSRALLPFLAAGFVALLLVTYIEAIPMFLPRLMGYVK